MAKEKLHRSRRDRIFGGVCGGLGQYFDIDSTVLRLIWVTVTIFSAVLPGVIIYISALFLVPKEKSIQRSIQATVIEMKGPSNN